MKKYFDEGKRAEVIEDLKVVERILEEQWDLWKLENTRVAQEKIKKIKEELK